VKRALFVLEAVLVGGVVLFSTGMAWLAAGRAAMSIVASIF